MNVQAKLAESRAAVETLHPGRGRELQNPVYVDWGRVPFTLGSWVTGYGGRGYARAIEPDRRVYLGRRSHEHAGVLAGRRGAERAPGRGTDWTPASLTPRARRRSFWLVRNPLKRCGQPSRPDSRTGAESVDSAPESIGGRQEARTRDLRIANERWERPYLVKRARRKRPKPSG